MPHIHDAPNQYDMTAGAYIVRIDGDEPLVILHKHRTLGKYLHFGGHIELNESVWSAVTHEITEESGYAMSQLKLLQPNMAPVTLSKDTLHPYPVAISSMRYGNTNHFHTDIAFAFVTHEDPLGAVSEDESSDIRALTPAELAAIPEEEIPEGVREIFTFILEECLPNWKQVDGTAFRTDNPI